MVESQDSPQDGVKDPEAVARWMAYRKHLRREQYGRRLEMVNRLRRQDG